MAAEPTVTCPKCNYSIKLTEAVAAPILAEAKKDLQAKLAEKDQEIDRVRNAFKEQKQALDQRKAQLDRATADLENQVAEKVQAEKERIAREEAVKARRLLDADLNAKSREIEDLNKVLGDRNKKLEEAQKAQAEIVRKERELEDKQREMELNIEKRVKMGLAEARMLAKQEAEDALNLKVVERDQTIAKLQESIEELKRRAEQGSQQLQGEVQELIIEDMLKEHFPGDEVLPVAKGEHGGDTLQRVKGPTGLHCGTILWESKRTKNWLEAWLPKLRGDGRVAKAEVVILVSQALPKGHSGSFDLIDGVWVTNLRLAMPLATILRQALIEVASARRSSEGQQTKTELVYQYLTGPQFRQRVQAIVEAFTNLREDLDNERKVTMKQWAKREKQIEMVMMSTVGMYGDLQGIAGRALGEVDGLTMPTQPLALEAPKEGGS
jgi:hypothetical protein